MSYGMSLFVCLGQSGPKEKWPLIHQPWFHGKMERIEAEAMLEKNGDFLVRESSKKPGQYVLTAIAMNKPQHLLLVDSTGKVCDFLCVRTISMVPV